MSNQPSSITTVLWLLCLLAATAMPVRAARRPEDGIALVAGFVVAAFLTLRWPPPAGGIALFIACVAGWQLLRPTATFLSSVVAGASAGCGATVLASLGAPLPVAGILAFAIAGAAWWCAQSDAAFAPLKLRVQALAGLTLSAPLIAGAPAINAGWQSALALNRTVENGVTNAMPAWIWQFAVLSVLIGILHGLLVRK